MPVFGSNDVTEVGRGVFAAFFAADTAAAELDAEAAPLDTGLGAMGRATVRRGHWWRCRCKGCRRHHSSACTLQRRDGFPCGNIQYWIDSTRSSLAVNAVPLVIWTVCLTVNIFLLDCELK